MATSYSPKTATDGLVFYYDTGNRKSYAGEPTTNLITHVLPNSSWVTNAAGTLITENYGLDPNGVLRSSKIVDNPNSGNGAFAYTSALNVSAGTYTFSAKVKTSSAAASANCYMVLYNMDPITNLGSTTFTNLTPGEWTNVAVTATLASGTTSIAPHFMTPTGNVNDFIEVVDVQLEQKSHATPFVNGTRSVTEGLRDLTGNRSIDLSNVSFDSNAQLTFDGTDDGAIVSDPVNLSSYSAITIEGVVKAAGIQDYDRWFSGTSGTAMHYPDLAIDPSGNLRYIFTGNGVTWELPGVNIDTTKYTHLVYVFGNDGSVEIFVNGISEFSTTHSSFSFPSVSRMMVGSRYDRNGEAVVGDIPVTKLYSRALSAAEVQANYNAIKGRFGL